VYQVWQFNRCLKGRHVDQTGALLKTLGLPDDSKMDRFLVQVNRDGGFANIMDNRQYENYRWMEKPRDKDHGEVKAGDELLIYCAWNVPKYKKSLAFSVAVKSVSPDHVTFEVEDPRFFASPLSKDTICELIGQGELTDVYRYCGNQGFNICKLTPDEAEAILILLNSDPGGSTKDAQSYSIEDIINDGCFLEVAVFKTQPASECAKRACGFRLPY